MGKIVKSLKKSIYFVDGNDLTIEMLFTLLAWLVSSVTEEYSFIGITVTNIFKRNCINFLFAPVINYHKDSDFKLHMYYLTILVFNGLKQVSLVKIMKSTGLSFLEVLRKNIFTYPF